MEALMERIRSRADQMRGLTDTAKSVRMGMADRRHSLDIQDKEIFQKCLDTLQTSISVRSAGGMSERLETIARQLNLKLIAPAQNQSVQQFYITSDNFYVEISMDTTGVVKSAIINHQNPEEEGPLLVRPAPQMVDCLNNQEFDAFVKHIEGLVSVYSLNCTPVEKSRAWQALWSVESDLLRLSQPALGWVTDVNQLIHKTPLGMVEERAGGLPMKLRFFVAPFALLDVKEKRLMALTEEVVKSKDLGLTVTIGFRASEEQFLTPLTSVISASGGELPLGPANSLPLPAHLTLEVGRPLPLSSALSARIAALVEMPAWPDEGSVAPLLSLIARLESKGSLDPTNNRGLFVTLPDQQHCYFMMDRPQLTGQVVNYIPFRHPAQVPVIVDLLRRQALFNALVASCVRVNSLEDVDTSIMFEVTCLDPLLSNISITFEHPGEEGMATVEVVLSDLLNPSVQLFFPPSAACLSPALEGDISRVLQRSLSLPVTMRSLIRRCQRPDQSSRQDAELLATGHGAEHQQTDGDAKGFASGRFKSESGRGSAPGTPAVSDPGGPGGGRIKQEEPMETSTSAESNSSEPLNRFGPQDVEMSLPGARKPTASRSQQKGHQQQFRRPSQASHNSPTDILIGERRKSDLIKIEPEDVGSSLSLAIAKFNTADLKGRPKGGQQQQQQRGGVSSKEGEATSAIMPFVSITPIIGKGDTQEPARDQRSESSGIEIIPLGGNQQQQQLKCKVRDLKRSYSEDDKRRMERKEKKRREELKHRGSVSPTKREGDSGGRSSSGSSSKDPKAKLAGVIERLAFQTGDTVGIEIRPANISSSALEDSKSRGTSSPSLKVTIKQNSSDRSTHEAGNKPAKTSSNHGSSNKPSHKINERFITDPGAAQRSDERKRSADSLSGGALVARRKLDEERRGTGDSPSVSLHLVKSPSHLASPLRQMSPAHQLTEGGGGVLDAGGGGGSESLLLGK